MKALPVRLHGVRFFPGLAAIVLLALTAGCTTTESPDTGGMAFSPEPLVGKVVWNDLITEDLAAARRFYGGLFGWRFEHAQAEGGREYTLARAGDVFVAGLVPVAHRPDDQPLSRWLPYLSVADVDQAVGRATAAGGRVAVGARDVRLGRVAAIVDPEGAVIGLARSAIGDPDDSTTAAAAGRIVWTELLADDPEAAAGFYRTVVGYNVRTVPRRGGTYRLLALNGIDRAGILANPSDRAKPRWLTYFGVDDPALAAAHAESLGGSVLLPVSPELRDGTMAVVADPSGAILVLQKLPR